MAGQTLPGAQPGGMQSPMGAEDDDTGKTELCITIDAQGGLTFSVEKDGQPVGQEQPASDIGQALKMALDAYKKVNQGGDGQTQFDQGFGGKPPKGAGMA